MKNTIKLLMCAVMAFCFASCTPEDGTEGNNSFAFNLNLQENTLLVSWKAVESAVYYEIQLNDENAIKTDKNVHKFEGLAYDSTYKVTLKALSATGKAIKVGTKSITIAPLKIYAYREFAHYAAASAISHNGKWVTGGRDMSGMIINLATNEMITTEYFEGYDIDNNGVAVGSYHGTYSNGVAAMFVNGEVIEIDLSNITENNDFSCLTGISPDGSYAVGWYCNYDGDNTYYARIYGGCIPFCYDVITNSVTVPAHMLNPIYNDGAMCLYDIAADGTLLGLDQQYIHINVVWENENTPYEYVLLDVEEETKKPLYAMGDQQNRLTASGRYLYGSSQDYSTGNQVNIPSVFDLDTNTRYTYDSFGKVSAMSDDGTVFVYDVEFGNTGNNYVTTLDKGAASDLQLLEEWLYTEHDIDVAVYEPLTNVNIEDNSYMLDGTNVIATSADGRTLLAITQTIEGWVTSVISLDGEKKE